MKQQITQEQYEELSDTQRQRFIEWTLSKVDQTVAYRSIGHLIWFLDEHGKNWKGFDIKRDMEEDNEDVLVKVGWTVDLAWGDVRKEGSELVDALWETVKALLESEEHDE